MEKITKEQFNQLTELISQANANLARANANFHEAVEIRNEATATCKCLQRMHKHILEHPELMAD